MTKQEFIAQEWNKICPTLSEEYDIDGFMNFNELNDNFDLSKVHFKNEITEKKHGSIYVRPKSLKDLEENNGWVLINGENSLPSLFCDLWVICDEKSKVGLYSSFEPDNHLCVGYVLMTYSHYQIVEKPKLPLFNEVL